MDYFKSPSHWLRLAAPHLLRRVADGIVHQWPLASALCNYYVIIDMVMRMKYKFSEEQYKEIKIGISK